MISSTTNPRIKLIRALQSKRKERETRRQFVIEGVRLAEEAGAAGVIPALVLHTEEIDARARAAVDSLARLGAPVEAVSAAVLQAASDTKTPQGILAAVPFPSFSLSFSLSFAVILDGVSDPGNLGTILRTADAAGAQVVYLAPGTVDAYNPKVVRAAMGAHFHLPIVEAGWEELKQKLAGLDVWLTAARAGEPYYHVDWRKPCALIIGSEAGGASAEALRFTPKRVQIPMPGRAESLNAAVAAGVVMFEMARQRGK